MILEEDIDGLPPLRHYGVTLYPADQLERIFDWSWKHGKRIAWIDAIRLSPGQTQPSMEYSVGEDASIGYRQFRSRCLETALAWIGSSQSCGMVAYFEIGISN
jgi:hypothetical protein